MSTPDLAARALDRVRALCLALPEVTERVSHGEPAWFVRGRTTVANFRDHHHDDGRLALWLAAGPGVQQHRVQAEPEQYFVPPYVGHRGWLGVRLDRDPDWAEVADLIEESYRLVAPRALVAQLDQRH